MFGNLNGEKVIEVFYATKSHSQKAMSGASVCFSFLVLVAKIVDNCKLLFVNTLQLYWLISSNFFWLINLTLTFKS
jgi:hypothetical protein